MSGWSGHGQAHSISNMSASDLDLADPPEVEAVEPGALAGFGEALKAAAAKYIPWTCLGAFSTCWECPPAEHSWSPLLSTAAAIPAVAC